MSFPFRFSNSLGKGETMFYFQQLLFLRVLLDLRAQIELRCWGGWYI